MKYFNGFIILCHILYIHLLTMNILIIYWVTHYYLIYVYIHCVDSKFAPRACITYLPKFTVCIGGVVSSIENVQAMKGCVIIKGDLIIDIPGTG